MSKTVFKGKTTDGTAYIIRYPKRTDLHELWKFINKISEEKTFISLQGEQITLEHERKWLNTQLKSIKDQTTVYLLTEANKKIIGVASINMSKNPIGTHVGSFGITIAKEYRHQGIGKKLMVQVMGEAKKNLPNLKIIVLGVFANNPIAIELYKEFGFKEYGKLPKGISHRGEFIDDIKMYKEI
jgi:ribosomal protein S18 acetylase RimI-like enzyme